MYGQMTAGSWIYIGTQGILQGTYETFAEAARQHFGGTLEGRLVRHRRPGRHGRRPAAGRDHERGVSSPSRSTRRASSGGWQTATSTSRRTASTRRCARAREAQAEGRRALHRPARQRRRRAARAGAARRHARRRDRPDQRPRPAERLRPEPHDAARRRCALRAPIPAATWRGAPQHGRARPRHARPRSAGRGHLRLRQQHPRARRRRRASRTRSTSPASCPPTSARCSARARARSAGSRSPAIPTDIARTDDAVLRTFPEDKALARWITLARERVKFRACPRASAGWATASGRRWASCSTTWCARAR